MNKRRLKKYLKGLGLGLERAVFDEDLAYLRFYKWRTFRLNQPWVEQHHCTLERTLHSANCHASQQLRYIAMADFIVANHANFTARQFKDLYDWAQAPGGSPSPELLAIAHAGAEPRTSPIPRREMEKLCSQYGSIDRSWLSPAMLAGMARLHMVKELSSAPANLPGDQVDHASANAIAHCSEQFERGWIVDSV